MLFDSDREGGTELKLSSFEFVCGVYVDGTYSFFYGFFIGGLDMYSRLLLIPLDECLVGFEGIRESRSTFLI